MLSVQRPRLLGFSVMQSLGPEVQCHGGELRFCGSVMMQSSDREVQHHSAELWSWCAVLLCRAQVLGCRVTVQSSGSEVQIHYRQEKTLAAFAVQRICLCLLVASVDALIQRVAHNVDIPLESVR